MQRKTLEAAAENLRSEQADHSPDAERFQRNRKWIAVLSALGLLDSGYLFLYQTGKVKHLWCPGLGGACDRIASSPKAYQGRIPDSLLGAAGYAALLGLALAGNKERYRTRPLLPRLMGGGTLVAFGLSALLTYVQKKEFDDFCFWCLVSAAISTLTFPLAMPEFLAALQTDSKSKINASHTFRSSTSAPGE